MSLRPYSLIRAGAIPREEIEGEIKRAANMRASAKHISKSRWGGAESGYAIALTVGIIALA